ncbi:membrane transporter [Candida orthopsilosis Co 90-125]|uniref:Membrane transporter n=1 Tax=Candida orthopsilosis (strain 90-125) TaxID=1136231 RepID=H8X0Q4_CANO9|nr:membrane transporter [Candida orthopsilosis Co 90-125]CCG21943.1 membrane transporter [Candida orthopsilosis Co 90-125]
MLSSDTPFAKRLTQCVCAIVWCLLCGGPIFGFAALKPILIKEHVYESLCDLHPEPTTSFVHSAANEVVSKCTPQDLKLNKIFTVAAVVTNVSALLIGHVLDNFGPKVCGLIGAGFLYLASFVFIYAKQIQMSPMWSSWFDPYLMGYSFLALGGPFTFISSFQLSNSFPERSGTILAMLTGAFDASSAVFLLYRIVYNKSHGEFTLDTFFRVYLLVPIFITIAQLTVMPSESYRTSSESVKLVGGDQDRIDDGADVNEESALLSSETPHRRDSIGDALKHPYEEEEYLMKHSSDPVVGILHGYAAQYQIKTYWFLLICLFSTIQMLKINYFVATVASQYQYIFQSYELATKLNKFFDVALPLGGIICVPLIGILLDNYSSLLVVSTLLSLSVLIGFLGLFSNYALAIIGVCLFVGYRPMFYTVISDLCAKVYGFETFGTVYGLIMTISGVFNYGQSYLDELTHTVFHMDPMPVNLMLILVTFVVGGLTVGYVYVEGNRRIKKDIEALQRE